MFGLIPKDEKFFEMFREMGTIITEGAEALCEMMNDFSDPVASQRKIKDIEHKGDHQTHAIINKLNKTFVTPFDREDIYALASGLDDILDLIDASAQRFVMYRVDAPPRPPRNWPTSSCAPVRPWNARSSTWAAKTRISVPAASISTPLRTRLIGPAARRSASCLMRSRTRSS